MAPETPKEPAASTPQPPPPQDQLVTTQHTLTVNGQAIPYTVTTGTIVLKEETEKAGENEGQAEGEKPKATIFFVAYTRDDVADRSTRKPCAWPCP